MLEHKIPTAVIASDEMEVKQISSEIKDLDEISLVRAAADTKKAISIIHEYMPQLLLVDVQINNSCGLEFVQDLHAKNIYPEVVFLASDSSRAFDTLSFKPLDFLLKPAAKDDINKVMDRLKSKLKRRELNRKMDIYARSHEVAVKRVFEKNKGIIILHLNEVVSCRSERSKTILTLINNEIITLKTIFHKKVVF